MALHKVTTGSAWPSHPGEILREDVIPTLRMPVSEVAEKLGVSRQTVTLCGNGPGLWLRLQQVHDLWQAERNMKDALARIPTLASVDDAL